MKKLLLTLAAAAMAFGANAQTTVCFNAEGNNYPGEATKVITVSGTTGDDGLIANTFTVPGALELKFDAGTNTRNNPGVGTWKHIRTYVGNTITITPLTDVTISRIKISYVSAGNATTFTCGTNGKFSLDAKEGIWNGSSTTAVVLTATGTSRFYYIEVTYTGGQVAVAEPTFSLESAFVEAGTTVALSCETEGAQIYYTLDGTAPDATSTLYTAPITIEGKTFINAVGVKEGAVNSNVVTGKYGVIYNPDGAQTAEFNFGDVTTLDPAQEKPATSSEIVVNDISFTSCGITLSFDKGDASTDCRIYNSNIDITTLRTYPGSTVKLTTDENITINNVEFVDANPFGLTCDAPHYYIIGTILSAVNAGVKAVELKSSGNSTIPVIKVNYTKAADGIENIAVDTNAPVEYYNLQGVRVAEPAPGLYIRRQGNVVSKVLVK